MGSPIGLHRVLAPAGVLPQAAHRLDVRPEIAPDEVRIRVERLNLDAASFRQLVTEHGGDGDRVRAAVLAIVEDRGKMHNPVTGSGGMLIGTVEEVGPDSPLGLRPGDRVATLVSLTLTPLRITDGLKRWDGLGEQVPCDGHAILFARSIAAVLPGDLNAELALAVLDVCGAPALVARALRAALDSADAAAVAPGGQFSVPDEEEAPTRGRRTPLRVAVLGAAGKSGSLSLAAARQVAAERGPSHVVSSGLDATGWPSPEAGAPSWHWAAAPEDGDEPRAVGALAVRGDVDPARAGAGEAASARDEDGQHAEAGEADPAVRGDARPVRGGSLGDGDVRWVSTVGVVRDDAERVRLERAGLADVVVVADARDAVGLAAALDRVGGPADLTVVCVDVPGCEHAAILGTASGGTVVFFSMATSFPAAALGAEGLAADVTMLIGNGYVPGHATYALDLLRSSSAVRALFEERLADLAP